MSQSEAKTKFGVKNLNIEIRIKRDQQHSETIKTNERHFGEVIDYLNKKYQPKR